MVFILAASYSLTSYAHSGRTDASGGHHNRKTGGYHYHNSGYKRPTPKTYTPSQNTTPSNTATVQIKPITITENHWQVALNNNLFNGKLEVSVSTGRVDIVTETFVIEVDKVSKYQEGIKQALKYAKATGKKPVLALYIDGERDGYSLYQKAEKLCKDNKVSLLLINTVVSVNDLLALVQVSTSATTKSLETESQLNYWLNTNSGVRHNISCRWYNNTKNGRKCTKSEGRACGTCGG